MKDTDTLVHPPLVLELTNGNCRNTTLGIYIVAEYRRIVASVKTHLTKQRNYLLPLRYESDF